jgi:hypothetical protein
MSVSFLHSLSVLLPALFVMTLGFWAGRTREFNQEQLDGLTQLVLKVLIQRINCCWSGTVHSHCSLRVNLTMFYYSNDV